MTMNMKRNAAIALVLILSIFTGCACCEAPGAANNAGDGPALVSEYWTERSEAAASLNDYLTAITDEASPDYIPVRDRVAVFDLDGTLMCETYPFCFEYMVFADYALNSGSETVTDDVRAVAQEIVDAAGGEKPGGMSMRQAAAAAVAYKGMTMAELAGIVDAFKGSEAWGFAGMTRGEAYYRPMVELFDALLENDFTVYIVTATERNIVREVIRGTLDIPPSQVIGTEYGYAATGQGDAADGDYTFQPEDQVVFDGNYYGENAKMSKVDAIVREIGQQPVLAFGNSSGDLAMALYTISGNPYRSAAYMVVADDEAREYGNAESAEGKKADYRAQGIGTISMRDDWKTIYGADVVKADAADGQEAVAFASGDAAPVADDVQYVLYLGTNDKDTNKPVFTQAEAMEKAKEILIRHFGGYTIQEAHGGWLDEGQLYQEYTLVIYLSDTTPEAVHAAADELIETFRQSSVLIHANPTATEFYAGLN